MCDTNVRVSFSHQNNEKNLYEHGSGRASFLSYSPLLKSSDASPYLCTCSKARPWREEIKRGM
jgi:hypothetical protein